MAFDGDALYGPGDISARIGHVAVAKDNYMLVWGGYTEDTHYGDRYLSPREVIIYHAEFNYWTCHKTAGDIPKGTSGCEACLLGDHMYVFGGHTDEKNTDALYCLDLKSFEWTQIPKDDERSWPSPRDKFASWTWENRLYCFGGFGPPLDKNFDYNNGYFVTDTSIIWSNMRGWNNQLWYFDVLTRQWTNPKCRGTAPLPRAAHKAVRFNTKVYIFGGRHDTTRMNDLHSFDLQTETWSGELCMEGAFPCGRSWHSLTAVSATTAFLYGGYSNSNAVLSDAWLLDVSALQWTQLTVPVDQPRLWHSSCWASTGDVLVFGGCISDILQNEEPVLHSNQVLLFKTQPYSLLRLCLEAAFINKELTRDDWTLLPVTLKNWLERKEKINTVKAPIHRHTLTINGSTCSVS